LTSSNRCSHHQQHAAIVLCAALLSGILNPAISHANKPAAPPPAMPTITIQPNHAGNLRLFVNDQPFPLRGAGGADAPGLLEQLVAAGGNVTRTWGIDTLSRTYANGETYLDRAHRLGLMVIPGLWVQHERHGFDYSDPAVIRQQREQILDAVRTYKDHPAILAWGLGNEMEGPSNPTGSIPVLREVNHLAQRIKALDPHRPIMTVIAFNPAKIQSIIDHCPDIDILGVNAYGSAAGVGPALKAAGWTKPFAITEFGVKGFWEVPTTAWGAPLEPTSQEKARTFYATHRLVTELNDGHERCLGTFAFLWGWKQERTATWFGMFLPSGEKLPQVDAMTKAWHDRWPTNRCPKLIRLSSDAAAATVPPNTRLTAFAEVEDPEADPLRYAWMVTAESTAQSEGGDAEYVPADFPHLINQDGQPECHFTSPATPGAYRLFLTVFDNRGNAATANFPFRVKATLQP
jgi:hypothetical protein